MEDEEDGDGVELFIAHFDASHRALAVHEAGHAVVARALGADIVFVEIDLMTGQVVLARVFGSSPQLSGLRSGL